MRVYDIYIGAIPYEEDEDLPTPRYKTRPVIILDNSAGIILNVAPITSHGVREWDSGDYKIIDWREAGLRKPSTARLDKLVDLNHMNLGGRVGRLTVRDIKNVASILGRSEEDIDEGLCSFPSY